MGFECRQGCLSLAYPNRLPIQSDMKPLLARMRIRTSWLTLFWLRLRLHVDAFRRDPLLYLTATWWRIIRKRVRARAQFAAIFGKSPLAYQLWLMRQTSTASSPDDGPSGDAEPVIALVKIASGSNGASPALAKTLASLRAEGIAAFPVDACNLSTLDDVAGQISPSTQAWFVILDEGDVLANDAGGVYRQFARSRYCLIYADDDIIDDAGVRRTPHFKPDWNTELFRHYDFVSGACAVRASATDLLACSGPEWDKQLIARAVAHDPTPRHVRKILHHRRSRPACKPVGALPAPSFNWPKISVIIPTRNRIDLLRTCLRGLEQTDYPDLEVIVIDNDSDDPATLDFLASLAGRVRVVRHAGAFNFAAMNNRAAALAKGQLLCLLNNDIEVLSPDWFKPMAQQALRDDVGAVGARLLYPDGRIQHAGVVIGISGAAAHAHRLLGTDDEGYFHRHALPQFVSAVTAACLVVRRDRFDAVGGFDEKNFAVAFNDVDLCLKLNKKGWQSLYEPRATLIHHESISRGLDRDKTGSARLAGELAALKAKWHTDLVRDPFHHPDLCRSSEQFVVAL